MKLTKTPAALALTLLIAAAPAAIAKPGKMKSNGKSKKTAQTEAYRGSSAAAFDEQFMRFDRNTDGVITRDEFPSDPLRFDRLDQNRDGAITRGELQFALRDPNTIQDQVRALDRNGDGMISRSEFPGDTASFNQLDRNRDGVLSQSDRNAYQAGQSNQMRHRGMDKNRDGVITRSEWRGNDNSFRQQDRNRDGVLSGSEVRRQ